MIGPRYPFTMILLPADASGSPAAVLLFSYDQERGAARWQAVARRVARPGNQISTIASRRRADRRLLLAPPLHRRGDPHRLAIFRDRPAGDVDARHAQFLHDGVVGEHVLRI